MPKTMAQYDNIDEYIAAAPRKAQVMLKMMRRISKELVPPETEEKISYGIPTYYLNGNLFHFGGYETHIGFYPGSAPIKTFEKDLAKYETAKGTIRFPLDQPLPQELIRKIIKVCVQRRTKK